MDKRYNIQIFLVFVIAIAVLIFPFFLNPSITGNVPIKIYRQNLSLMINESQNFLLTSDNLEPFTLTSFKISGNIAGNGQVRIYIDSGKGQKVLVYKNIVKNSDSVTGLRKITGRGQYYTENKNINEQKHDKWLIIKPIKILLEKEVFDEVSDNEQLVSGPFSQQCTDTCFIKMEVSRNIAYRLIFLVEKGVVLKINEIVYQTEELSA